MIKLYGTPISNYYNKIKLSMLEMGVPFEEAVAPPSQDAIMLTRSPMGKVPFIEVDGKWLAESQGIVEYLADAYPAQALYPKDAWERAKVREVIQIMELYLDGPSRELIGPVFFGAPLSDETKTRVQAAWVRGTAALERICRFSPFVAGNSLTYADCAASHHFPLASSLSNAIYGKDVLDGIKGAKSYLDMMKARPHSQTVAAGFAKAFEAFMAAKRK